MFGRYRLNVWSVALTTAAHLYCKTNCFIRLDMMRPLLITVVPRISLEQPISNNREQPDLVLNIHSLV